MASSLTFFAVREDLLSLLEFVFTETGARVFESYSDFDRDLREFESADAVDRAFRLGLDEHGTGSEPFLQLWWPAVCPRPRIERITLKPGAVPGHSFRHTARGWGLAQLQCGGEHSRNEPVITASHFGHFSEAGAREKGYVENGPDAPVDWAALQRVSQRVQRRLRTQLAGGRVPQRGPVLHAAAAKARAGWKLKESGRWPAAYELAPLKSKS
jgi:hypothetical protein